MTLKDKLSKITSDKPTTWQQEAATRASLRGARDNSRRVALRVLNYLKENGISQTELANKMGVSRQHVAKIVKGQENFTFETIEKLETALGMTLINVPLTEDRNPTFHVPSRESQVATAIVGLPNVTVIADQAPALNIESHLASLRDKTFRLQLLSKSLGCIGINEFQPWLDTSSMFENLITHIDVGSIITTRHGTVMMKIEKDIEMESFKAGNIL